MKSKIILSVLAALFLFTGFDGPAEARHRGSIRNSRVFRDDFEIRNRDAVRMQREAISAQEEARREEGRRERRQELEQELKQSQVEFLESQASIRAESQAARNAPRGFFYRKPGTKTGKLPAGAKKISLKDRVYYYYRGIYYREDPGGYFVVTPPPGAQIDELPGGHSQVQVEGVTLYYYFGSYYRQVSEGYAVTSPVSGAVVSYLPDGYTTERAADGTQYLFAGVRYRPYYREGVLVYAVEGK